jgi:hypothetical protein
MKMIKIENNVPIPKIVPKTRGSIYPFAGMTKVGDSFFVAVDEEDFEDEGKRVKASILGAARRYRNNFTGEGPKFVVLPVVEEYPEDDENYGLKRYGVRCWLTELAE